jgi:hypothetical protein
MKDRTKTQEVSFAEKYEALQTELSKDSIDLFEVAEICCTLYIILAVSQGKEVEIPSLFNTEHTPKNKHELHELTTQLTTLCQTTNRLHNKAQAPKQPSMLARARNVLLRDKHPRGHGTDKHQPPTSYSRGRGQ